MKNTRACLSLLFATFVGCSSVEPSLVYSVTYKQTSWDLANSWCRSLNKTLATPGTLKELENSPDGSFWLAGYREGVDWKWYNGNNSYRERGCFVNEYHERQANTRIGCRFICYRNGERGVIIYQNTTCVCLERFDLDKPPRAGSCNKTGGGDTYLRYWNRFSEEWEWYNHGCFVMPIYKVLRRNSVEECSLACAFSKYIALQGDNCTCLPDYYRPTNEQSGGSCDIICSGNNEETCGSNRYTTLYESTGNENNVDLQIVPDGYYEERCLSIVLSRGTSQLERKNCYENLQTICQSAAVYGTSSPTTQITTPDVIGGEFTEDGKSKSGLYAGIAVGISFGVLFAIVILILWKRKNKTKEKKSSNLQMNETNSGHSNDASSHQNPDGHCAVSNSAYGLQNNVGPTYGAIYSTTSPDEIDYGKIWIDTSKEGTAKGEYSYAKNDSCDEYDYAGVSLQEREVSATEPDSTEYDRLGVPKTQLKNVPTSNTYSHAGSNSQDYVTGAKDSHSNVADDEYSHLGEDEDMYEMEQTNNRGHLSDTYTHLNDY